MVAPYVVELECLSAELADLPLHQIERLATLERVTDPQKGLALLSGDDEHDLGGTW